MQLLNIDKTSLNCAEKNMYECFPGHIKCYTEAQKCAYNLTKDTHTLMYCRNGKHLQDCESKNCESMFKCPKSYCIPYRYICNGEWDCWNGEDELNCKSYSCVRMFKCKLASICIHTNNACDGVIDCPFNDDETLCDNIMCVAFCNCINYGISCKDHSLLIENLLSRLQNFFLIHFSRCHLPQSEINKLCNVKVSISNHNNLENLFGCDLSFSDIVLEVLDMNFNEISKLKEKDFKCLPQLVEIKLGHNNIVDILDFTFRSLSKVKALFLDENKIIYLYKYSFHSLRKAYSVKSS